jgi:hypothetical protein
MSEESGTFARETRTARLELGDRCRPTTDFDSAASPRLLKVFNGHPMQAKANTSIEELRRFGKLSPAGSSCAYRPAPEAERRQNSRFFRTPSV